MQILIAKITSPHGIKGQVKLISYLENPSDLEKYNSIFTKDNKNFKIKLLRSVKQNIYIAKINDINDRNKAEEIKNTKLFIDQKELKILSNDQFYYHDLIGIDVKNIEGKKIAIVKNIMNFGAGDLFEVDFTDDNYNNQMNILPFNNEIVTEINLEEKYMIITAMNIL
ncbi:ribosome maturation factor RimM [Rickettsiales bacterium]|nr:ribosome maturation factor RimM [Rickettsiales bacterium]MDB2550449.1 ribosome maturation factor RimM [Rickettsiales bacterium]